LREEILAHLRLHANPLCIVDGIQKIPALLDEVYELIESRGIRFILTGSSARKLRRGGANLLAGRAYTYRLFPLTFMEDNPDVPAYVLGNRQHRRQLKGDITVINWDDFVLEELQ
jgi:hypothetical protein